MAGNIKGITIEIGGNTTKLEQALKKVNTAGKDLNIQLKDINKSLKFNPGNAELIAQKQRVLAEAVSNTKSKLETLKIAQEQAKQALENGKIGIEEYEALAREIIKTENELKRFQGELRNTGREATQLEQISEQIKKIDEASEKTKTELKEVNEALKLDPKNVELTAQKQELLAQVVDESKEKLRLLKEQQEEAHKAFERGEIGAEEYRKVTREVAKAKDELKNFQKEQQKVNSQMYKMGEGLQNFGSKAEKAGKAILPVSAAAGAATVASVKMASDFENAMAKVSTIADDSVPFDDLKKQIVDLSNQTGISSTEIADNVYNAISAGQDTADAVNFVANATKLATAGFSDSAATTDILTTALNAYGMEADEVTNVSDMLIQTQNRGKTTVGELASAMGKVIPTAKNVNVGFEQLATGYVLLTKNGIQTREATTYLNSMFNELGKSGSKTDKMLKDLTGKSFKDLQMEGKNTADILQILKDGAEKSGLSLSDMFGSAEAGKAAMTILQDGVGGFSSELEMMKQSVGATDEAFEKLQTPSKKMQIALNELKNIAIEIGTQALPYIQKFAEGLKSLADKFSNLSPAQQKVIMLILALTAAIGPVLIFIGKMSTGIGAIIKLFSLFAPAATAAGAGATAAGTGAATAGVGFTAMLGPIALVIAAIAAIIAIGVLLYKNWDTIKENAGKLFETISATWNNIKQITVEIWDGIKTKISNTWNNIKQTVSEKGAEIKENAQLAWEKTKDTTEMVWGNMKSGASSTWSGIKAIIGGEIQATHGVIKTVTALISGDWKGFGEGTRQISQGMWKVVNGIFGNALESIKTLMSKLPDDVKEKIQRTKDEAIKKAKEFLDIGKHIVSGIVDGITQKAAELYSAGEKMIEKILGGSKKRAEIHSPAKVFEREVGENITKGTAQGIRKGEKYIEDALEDVHEKMMTSEKNNSERMQKLKEGEVKRSKERIKKLSIEGVEKQYYDYAKEEQNCKSMNDTANEQFSNLKKNITEPILQAKDILINAITIMENAIRNMKIEIPKSKLPKIEVAMSEAGGIQAPNFDVSWHKHGEIFTKPTIRGTTKGLHGAGEDGAETVLSSTKMNDIVINAVNKAQGEMFSMMLEVLKSIDNNINATNDTLTRLPRKQSQIEKMY